MAMPHGIFYDVDDLWTALFYLLIIN